MIEVVIRWLGGSESRHEVHQGLRRYDSLGDHTKLKDRVKELRGAGQTGEQIAEMLNRRAIGRRGAVHSPATEFGDCSCSWD